MRNVWLIAKREYLERIKTKGFVVMTVLIPLIMGGGSFAGGYFGARSKAPHITIVSMDTQVAIDAQTALAASDPSLEVDLISPPGPDTRHTVTMDLEDRSIDGFVWIDPAAEKQVVYFGRPSSGRLNEIREALDTAVAKQKVSSSRALAAPVAIDVQQVEHKKRAASKDDGGDAKKIVAYLLFFLMYMAVMLYGMNVARSITEEKTSRVFEVMLATISPEEMMAGKVIGVGGVGLTQVFIWIGAAVVALMLPTVRALLGVQQMPLGPIPIFFSLLFFVLGFMLYSSIAAILGAMVNSEQELQQLTMFMAMPLAVCFFLFVPISNDPNGALATWISLVPLWTPLIMFIRIAVGTPPWWQVGLSIVDMFLAIYAMMWIASRIYRVGVLMYGKKPSLRELLRWLRYS